MFHKYHETEGGLGVTLGIWTCRYTTQYTISQGWNSCVVCLYYPYGFMCHILTRAVHVIPMNLSIYRHSHKICFMWCFMWSIWIGVPYHETDNSVNKYFISGVWGRHVHYWNLMIRCGSCTTNLSGDRRLSQRYLGEPELPKVTQAWQIRIGSKPSIDWTHF